VATALQQYLDAAGFSARKPQVALFEHLITATSTGVIAQAGTGTGKSAAILSAAADRARESKKASIVVTPTLTLMNQYLDGDVPVARKAFEDLKFAELRGKIHYRCDLSAASANVVMPGSYVTGCDGYEVGCTMKAYETQETIYECGYQAAKLAAMVANVVVTNSDMLIVNDRILRPLGAEIFDPDGSLFVDEAHTLEQKLRDYASRSIFHKNLEGFSFAGTSGPRLANWLARQERAMALSETKGFPMEDLIHLCSVEMPAPYPGDKLTRQRQTQEGARRLYAYLQEPHDSAVAYVDDGSLKLDWINIAASSRELLTSRSFGLVSATIPKTMASSLGVVEAPFVDVGHPFDYRKAFIGFSQYSGSYRDSKVPQNFDIRFQEVEDLIRRAKGGVLMLFSAFSDMEEAERRLAGVITELGLTWLIQGRETTPTERQKMAETFKADGNAILFGSASFATGFDVPGNALRCVILWKLPYPSVDPVNKAIMNSNPGKYQDSMTVSAVQGIGRLIRTTDDTGVVWVADSRGRRLVNGSDPLTRHLTEFSKLN